MYHSLYSFNDSHFLTKAEEVFGFGDFIESWSYTEVFVALYAYSNFFIEVSYSKDAASIINIEGISAVAASDKYVSHKELVSALQSSETENPSG